MAAELVGDAFLSASLDLLFERMASKEVIDFVRGKKLNQELLNKLKIMLLSANRVLNDAEKKQLTDPDVRQWLHYLKDAIYDAEDLVYEINTEALRCELELVQSGSRTLFRVQNFFSSRFTFQKVEQRLVEILGILQFILEQKDVLGLKECVHETRPFPRLSAATLVEVSDIYGRDADKEAIIQLLLSSGQVGEDNKVCVIPIVGIGGIGKTTLAQLIYSNVDSVVVNNPFDIKAWITVSEDSDLFTLTKTIYEAVTKSPNCCIKELFQLQLKLKEFLKEKKFLFVLDNVRNLNYEYWYDLKRPLDSAAHGSRIIVTTRSTGIASVMGTVPNHDLHILSKEDCWKLFAKHAFNNVEPSAHPDLEVIGRQIVQKCRGLPLAIKSLGSLLRSSELNPLTWENILKNDILDLPKEECGILPALWLSYHYLQPHLKRCFAYCSVFPKDYVYEEEKLILLWMAEDLLQPQKNKTLEEVGENYLKDLTSRSFFHRNHYGQLTMHDLVNDLANFVSGESCLRLDENYSEGLLRKTRHLSSTGYKVHDMKKIEEISKNKVLRTLLVLDGRSYTLNEHCMKHHKQLQSMRYLRVLSASEKLFTYEEPHIRKFLDSIGSLKLLRYLDLSHNSSIKEVPGAICTLYNLQTLLFTCCWELISVPDSIGNLKHLRYLDLSYTRIEKVPDTICNLNELHTLLVCSCKNLTRLPTNITTLINLRHLNIRDTSLREMPQQISNLKNLQTLGEFVVGKDGGGSNINEMGKIQDQCGFLHIRRLENVENVEDVSEVNLKDKKCITELTLEWNGDTDDSHKAFEILNRLQPPTNLESLSIKSYGGTNFPDWVGHHSFSYLTSVKLIGCKNCFCLPPLGQLPSLKSFDIRGFDMVERIGEEFYSNGSSSTIVAAKPFISLESISFSNMSLWEEWLVMGVGDEGGIFSKVEYLSLEYCEKLNEECLPCYLPSLKELFIRSGSQLMGSLSRCQYPSLGILGIYDCGEVESFPQGRLPSNIHRIDICECKNLVSLSEEGWPSNLESLKIFKCGKLFSPSTSKQWNLLPTTLTSLELLYLQRLESISNMAFQHLTSLEHLSISHCDQFQSLTEQGLPTTLTYLALEYLPNLKSLSGNAFQHLTSLKRLVISACDQLQCLPEPGLPTTLTSFHLRNLQNLKTLNGEALLKLTSLEELLIIGCKQLQCLPEERLPRSLSRLSILECPLLIPRCQRGIGEDWHKIAYIPHIEIDHLQI